MQMHEDRVPIPPTVDQNPLKSDDTEGLGFNLVASDSESLDPCRTVYQPNDRRETCGKPQPILEVQVDQRILYIGAGNDIDCYALAEQVGPNGLVASIMTSLNPPTLRYENLIFLVTSLTALPFNDNEMDWVVSNHPLTSVEQNEANLREFMRILKPGGHLSAPVTLTETDLGSLWSQRLEAIKIHGPSIIKDISIEPAKEDDLLDIQDLLTRENLPAEVKPHLENYVVARHFDRVIGCSGMECHGVYAVLRSLTVEPAYRRSHVGSRLLAARNQIAVQRGITRGYMLTATIAPLVEKWGYQKIDRSQVPPVILETSEFQSDQCVSATILYWDFSAKSS